MNDKNTTALAALGASMNDAANAFRAFGAAAAKAELQELAAYTAARIKEFEIRSKWGVFAHLFPEYRKARRLFLEYASERA